MPRLRLTAFALTAACLLAATALAQIQFVFNPPNITYTSERTRSQFRYLDSRQQAAVATTVTTRHQITATVGGFTVVNTPQSFVARQNGNTVENRPAEVMAMVPYTLTLGGFGEALEAKGFERLPKIIDAEFDSTAALAIKARVNANQLAQMAISEWNGRNGFRTSAEGDVGELIFDQPDYTMPNGSKVKYYSVRQIVDTARLDGQLCARLRITADSNPDSLARTLGFTTDKIKEVFALTDDQRARAGASEFRLFSKVELVWELKTGLMRSERIERHVARTMSAGGAASTMETVEDETATYTYPSRP